MISLLNTPSDSEQRAAAHAEALLPRPPGVLRRWLAAHPNTVDWIIVGSYLFGCGLMILVDFVNGVYVGSPARLEYSDALALEMSRARGHLQWPWVLIIIMMIVLVAVSLKLRRRYPLAGLIVVSLLLFFEQGLLSLPNSVAIYFLLYAIPVYRNARMGWIGCAIAAVLGAVLVQLSGGSGFGLITPAGIAIAEGPFGTADFSAVSILNAVWLLVVLLVGINLGNRRRYVEALIDRAHQLAREREQQGQLAAAAERARIAREMHDVVAHSLSVVVTLSEAASVAVASQPVAAQQAMQRAAETGRGALGEMRRLLGVLADGASGERDGTVVLNSGGSGFAPQPGIAQLAELVAGFAEAGLRISFTESGSLRGDPAQQLACYRIIQEGLTNSLRHSGPGTRVDLALNYANDATEITLQDSGPRSADDAARVSQLALLSHSGSGRGLAGMLQRAQLFGGSIEYGPHRGGWRIVASIPKSSPAVEPRKNAASLDGAASFEHTEAHSETAAHRDTAARSDTGSFTDTDGK